MELKKIRMGIVGQAPGDRHTHLSMRSISALIP